MLHVHAGGLGLDPTWGAPRQSLREATGRSWEQGSCWHLSDQKGGALGLRGPLDPSRSCTGRGQGHGLSLPFWGPGEKQNFSLWVSCLMFKEISGIMMVLNQS